MSKRQWNLLLPGGFGLILLAFLSYFAFFAYFPLTRDFPWLNLLLFLLGFVMLGSGTKRAYRETDRYRGKIRGPVFALLSVLVFGFFLLYNFHLSAQLPSSKGAPLVGDKARDFTLPDQKGNLVTLSKLWEPPPGEAEPGKDRWVLLVFYRGYW